MSRIMGLVADAVAVICIVCVGVICVALTIKFAVTYIF